MSKKIRSAARVHNVVSAFRCPLCASSMRVVDHTSLICSRNHTYDFAKQGYLNLMTHPINSQYNKELFEARHRVIMESNLYSDMYTIISNVLKDHFDALLPSIMITDLGCGEGSHMQRILEECHDPRITGVGLDISKEGILMAAKQYEDPIWLVGDLANSPLAGQSFHVILNILSPSNYKEFKRMLANDGLVIKVIPRSNYLIELREALFKDTEKESYKNDQITSLFKEHFEMLNMYNVSYTKVLTRAELLDLVQMSPLAWSAKSEDIEGFINRDSGEITIDLEILVGVNKS
ncbi:23S rRNA (guanine745-N1)-methyltransferase [Cytobacillus eiseniae]|uniref:23S rRNA (Guanine745-N1)-methyltransferase n=1 Tax=Cytobacillus eiseniae TaxID=762947 RepID=A0ABS4RDJ9_9BACI|nr:methyltransferase domain-containing protein [Cytobacillus eiseniae]MBP2240972.1 23S rRNA (guanine745-N1)-methyltransferase [Cytobacillus eiseniae]